MKQKAQLGGGAVFLLAGLALFVYYGTRTRPSGGADPEIQREAFLHDLATFAGLGLLFLGCLLLLLGAAGRWNETHRQTGGPSRPRAKE